MSKILALIAKYDQEELPQDETAWKKKERLFGSAHWFRNPNMRQLRADLPHIGLIHMQSHLRHGLPSDFFNISKSFIDAYPNYKFDLGSLHEYDPDSKTTKVGYFGIYLAIWSGVLKTKSISYQHIFPNPNFRRIAYLIETARLKELK